MMKNISAVREMFDNCTASRVRLIARSVSSIYDQAVARHGVTIAQVNLLVTLADFGPSTLRKIGAFLRLERSTMSRNLDLLMKRGLVEAISSNARGIREVAITPVGLDMIEVVLPDWRAAQMQAAQLLGQDGMVLVNETVSSIWNTQL
jgi:DNA-binding MarR family transcriptional regulator